MKTPCNTFGGITLTKSQCAIIRLMLTGLSRKEIAAARHTVESTVHSQCHLLFTRLGIHKNTELVAWALRNKFK